MKNSVQIEESKNTKLFNLLQLLLRKLTAAVPRIQKAECRKQDEKTRIATLAPGSLFSILIIVLLVLNGLLVAGSGDNLYVRPLALGFLAIASIVFLAVSARSNAFSASAQNARQSSKRDGYDRFFSRSPDMLYVIGLDGYFKPINPAAEKILGYFPAEMVGKLLIEFVHPDDRETTIKQAKSIAAGNNNVGVENRWRCRNGSYKLVAWTVSPFCEEELIYGVGRDIGEYHQLDTIKTQVKDDCGNALGLIGLGGDVTKQKEAQRQLQESEARFRKLAEQEALLNQLASNIRESLDLDTILATTVQQIRDFLQLDRCVFIWYLPDASPPAWDVVHEAKNDDLFSLLGYFPADITGMLSQKIANLEVYQIDDVATVSDPVERKLFVELGYKSVLDLPMKSAGGLTGVVGCVSCSEVHKWTKEEVELIEAIGAQLAIAISQSELYTKSVDSARIAQEQAAQLEVTQCELKLAQTQLVQAEKMSSLGQMVAGIAHEINNPISFIFGNLTYTQEYTENLIKLLQMYQDEYPEPSQAIQEKIEALELDFLLDDLPKILSSMKGGATRIRDIVQSLRNFSRLEESDMKPVNIHEGIDSTLMILEHRLKAQPDRPLIQLVKEYGQLPLVECYAGLLNQVFMNIIANAIDVLQEQLQNPGIIRIRTEVEGTLAVIIIADNGAGITDQVKQRIFDPFFTTKPIGSGTGMGLAISHSIIVEKHKGEIKCLSGVGKGTEFTIKIPIKRTEN